MWISRWVVLLLLELHTLAWCQSFYDADPHIMELTPKNFEKVIHGTNYTTMVEFYAPWCGYCQQLKTIIKKTAKSLHGVVQVAAVNCDLAKNKQLCAQHRVQGFPTLMVFRPPKVDVSSPASEQIRLRNHASEVYKGERKLSPIVDFAISRIKNYVKRLNGANKLESIFAKSSRYTLVLFSKKDKVSPIYKSIALDWLGDFDCYTLPNSKLKPLSENDSLSKSHPNIFKFLQDVTPEQMESQESMLVVFDTENDEASVFTGKSFTKSEISKFLSETYDITPREGPLSKREKYLEYVRSGKKEPSEKKIKNDIRDEL